MRVESISLALRPRTMFEAMDLGLRLACSHWRDVARSFGPVFAAILVLALASLELAPWAPMLLIFLAKPWMDRTLLWVYSRAAFGQSTHFADVWRAQRSVWWGQLLSTWTLRRLSLGRAYTQPVYQLEGQRGAALRKRRKQVVHGQVRHANVLQLVFVHFETFFLLGMYMLIWWALPSVAWGSFFDTFLLDDHTATAIVRTLMYGMVVALVEPLYVASGFCMYLNRRVQLEAWDIEQEFRRAF